MIFCAFSFFMASFASQIASSDTAFDYHCWLLLLLFLFIVFVDVVSIHCFCCCFYWISRKGTRADLLIEHQNTLLLLLLLLLLLNCLWLWLSKQTKFMQPSFCGRPSLLLCIADPRIKCKHCLHQLYSASSPSPFGVILCQSFSCCIFCCCCY